MVLIIALVCVASAARAEEARESRYGPSPDRRTTSLTAASGYAGPVLGWAGKQEINAARPNPAPQPVALNWSQMGSRQLAATPAPATPTQAQARQPMSEPWRNLRAMPEASAPTPEPSTHVIREPIPVAPARPAPVTTARYSPPPQAMAPSMARTYSVGRQYGLQPDSLPPLQPNGMVFIAPSDEAPRLKDDEPRHGSAEWMAAGARADEDNSRDDGKDSAL